MHFHIFSNGIRWPNARVVRYIDGIYYFGSTLTLFVCLLATDTLLKLFLYHAQPPRVSSRHVAIGCYRHRTNLLHIHGALARQAARCDRHGHQVPQIATSGFEVGFQDAVCESLHNDAFSPTGMITASWNRRVAATLVHSRIFSMMHGHTKSP